MPKGILRKDLKGLNKSNLNPTILKMVRYARTEARAIKDRIEPNKFNSWEDLVLFCENCLSEVKRKENILKNRMEKGDM